jgi:hypothetical protein
MENINKILKIGLIVVFIATTFSCKKDDSTAPEPTITINIQSPTEGTVLQHGDTLRIDADVTSPVQLHGYEWILRSKNGNTELASGSDHVHELNFSITGEYINIVTDTTMAELEIVAEVDHEGNETTKKVNIILYP